ncbi:MAG: multicopper oxidase domain-containing protein [Bacteroidetes bacterium]|nr:multicopper oxidase domain-containing protein [Bacteroidota bacterium]
MSSNWFFRVVSAALCCVATLPANAQNPLLIPDTLVGPNIQLNVAAGTMNYFPGLTTPTLGYNGNILGPTLLLNTGDSVTFHVTNQLNTATTVHWHGFHVAPEHDGGPHQLIAPNTTWSPGFKIRNRASTLWYHPHGEGKTELQVTRGLAGFAIVRDAQEAAFALPRKYGVDDFPIVLQSKAVDVLGQFAIATHEDSIMLVNGTLNPYLNVPQQVVRFRLLNGSADRTYWLGLSDNADFSLIASDGGLLSAPLVTNRVRLSPGERAEILVSFASSTIGDSLDMISYASELPHGIIGADTVGLGANLIGEGYYTNPLNGQDFRVLRLHVAAPTSNPILAIPAAFDPVIPIDTNAVDEHRHLHFAADTAGFGEVALVDGPFHINAQPFNMDSINIRTQLNHKEIWTLTNATRVAHPFHIHDIQFFVLDINGNPPPPQYAGWKDVILVMPEDTVRFVAVFDDFANDSIPYMYHCHLLHHEDDGMMGQFLVMNPATGASDAVHNSVEWTLFPNPATDEIQLLWKGNSMRQAKLQILDSQGKIVLNQSFPANGTVNIDGLSAGIYLLKVSTREGVSVKKFLKR